MSINNEYEQMTFDNKMEKLNQKILTFQVFLCTDELMLDYNRTISVGQNAHHLAKNFGPKEKIYNFLLV